jgi:hypothetical protein
VAAVTTNGAPAAGARNQSVPLADGGQQGGAVVSVSTTGQASATGVEDRGGERLDASVCARAETGPGPHARNGWFMRAVGEAPAIDPTFPRITIHDLLHTAASLAVSWARM